MQALAILGVTGGVLYCRRLARANLNYYCSPITSLSNEERGDQADFKNCRMLLQNRKSARSRLTFNQREINGQPAVKT